MTDDALSDHMQWGIVGVFLVMICYMSCLVCYLLVRRRRIRRKQQLHVKNTSELVVNSDINVVRRNTADPEENGEHRPRMDSVSESLGDASPQITNGGPRMTDVNSMSYDQLTTPPLSAIDMSSVDSTGSLELDLAGITMKGPEPDRHRGHTLFSEEEEGAQSDDAAEDVQTAGKS